MFQFTKLPFETYIQLNLAIINARVVERLTLVVDYVMVDRQAFEKFENPIFFKIFKIPSNGLEPNQNFFQKKFQQIQSLQPFKVLAKMGCGQQAGWAMTKILMSI